MNEHFDLADDAIRAESWAEAEEHLRKGLARQPDALAYGRLAYCLTKLGRDREALAAADAGLRLDPSLGFLSEMREVIAARIGDAHPAEPATAPTATGEELSAEEHTDLGWDALYARKPAEALDQFRTALMLAPGLRSARVGIVKALKANSLFFRLLLGGLTWFHRLAKFALLVFLGLLLYSRMGMVRGRNAGLVDHLFPFVAALFVLTMIAEPLVNLVLRLSRYGRLALSPEQTAASNWVGVCLFLGVGAVVWALVGGGLVAWLGAAVCGLLMVPAAALFSVRRGWPRAVLGVYTAALASIGLGGVLLFQLYHDPKMANRNELLLGAQVCLLGFVIGLFIHGYLVSLLTISVGRHRE